MDYKEELQDIAPTLAQWSEKEGYIVPTGYFESLADTVIARSSEQNDMQSYFDELPNQVWDRIQQEGKEVKSTVSIRSFYRYGAAAAVLIAIGSFVWSYMADNEEVLSPAYATTAEAEEFDYILNYVSLAEILDADILDDEILEDILALEQTTEYEDDIDEYLYDINDDEILEEFL